ncbi:MAG: hypothetical protein WAX14_12190 [Rhodococcus sp. (in: high G+C Gram-positive bacteria)]|uniref:hypothetical protein n=1 Tax=Rhodococcus sp. TaxID=1831 RepID=UPI003BB5C9FB
MTSETCAGLIDEFTARAHQTLFKKTVISPEDLAAWVTDGAPLPAAPRKESYRLGSVGRGNDDRLAELNGMPGRDKVLDFLSDYVRDFVPAPAITEDDHWVVTLRTQPGVLSRINIGPVHVAVVVDDEDRCPVRVWVAESPLRAALDGGEFEEIFGDTVERLEGKAATQPAGGEDQVSFWIDTLDEARGFLAHPAVAQAVRLYNARQAIRRTSWHSAHVPALVDGAFTDTAVAELTTAVSAALGPTTF